MQNLLGALATPPEILRLLARIPGLYVVGGFLRDAWWGSATKDIDLAAAGPLEPVLEQVQAVLGASSFELNKRFASHRLCHSGWEVDITPLHDDGLSADIDRRDYTINALAVPVHKLGAGVSPEDITCHGRTFDDLAGRRLRMVSPGNLADDPVRILRGYRLQATHGLAVEALTRGAWRDLAGNLTESAQERLHEELTRLFACPGIAGVIRDCGDDGVLWELFPALRETTTCEQNNYHDRDTWLHTLAALEALDELLGSLPDGLGRWAGEIQAAWDEPVSGAATAGALTRLALLLHDIGKPATREVQPDGRITFHNHQDTGAEMISPVLDGLKFAVSERDFIVMQVKEHLRLGFYSDHLPLSKRLVYRYLRRLGKWTPAAVLHALADCRATLGMADNGWERHIEAAVQLLNNYFSRSTAAAPPLFLDGNEIMELLQIKPSRIIGILKNAMLEATAVGDVTDRDSAKEFIRQAYQKIRNDLPN